MVISPRTYNAKVGLAILCPVTRQAKGYPFEVVVPDGLEVEGVVLSDQVKNLDWRARRSEFLCKLPPHTMTEVIQKLGTLVS